MATKRTINIAASNQAKLFNLSKERKEDMNLVLKRFAIERFLYRLSKSKYVDKFVLKGAMLFVIWEKWHHRPTRDVDFLGFVVNEVMAVETIFKEICECKVEDDGLIFDATSVKGESIKKDARYIGVRIKMTARLGRAKIPVQADIGYGDLVVPSPKIAVYPSMLGLEAPQLMVYSTYTVIAEKFHAMVYLELANSRMKDFYDIWYLLKSFDFEGKILNASLEATFNRQQTVFPKQIPICLTQEFYGNEHKIAQWNAFLKRNSLPRDCTLEEVSSKIQIFIDPLISRPRDVHVLTWKHQRGKWA